jgi:phage gp36-like protein
LSAYGITTADMAARLTPRTLAAITDDTAGRTIDEAIVTEKVLDAEAIFHSYAGVYYVVPIASTSSAFRIAKKVIIDLAAWELLSRRPHAISGDVGEAERARNEATLSWLKGLSVRERRVQLTGSQERVNSTPPSGGATVIADDASFTDEALALF